MSIYNIKGFPFVVLNEEGFYELFDRNGNKIDLPARVIRITQTAGEIDKIVIVSHANIVTKEQMQKLINEWQTKYPSTLNH
jgi:hypothetical protein